MLEYQLHNENTSLSFVFGELERNREMLNIEEYSVSQTTLDQVNQISTIVYFPFPSFFNFLKRKCGFENQFLRLQERSNLCIQPELTVPKKMATCTFNHNSLRVVNVSCRIIRRYRTLKRSSLVEMKLLHTLSMLAMFSCYFELI